MSGHDSYFPVLTILLAGEKNGYWRERLRAAHTNGLVEEIRMDIRFVSTVLTSVFLVSGCGSGGYGGAAACNTRPIPANCQIVTPPPPPPSLNVDARGIWSGQVIDDSAPGVSQQFTALMISKGEFRYFSVDTHQHFVGTWTVNGDQITGTGLAWSASGSAWSDGSLLTSIEISATVTARSEIDGSWTTGSGDSGTMTFAYDPISDRAPPASREGVWFYTDGAYSISITIDGIGHITGSDTDGCLLDGRVDPTSNSPNIFLFAFDLNTCGVANGQYDGLGFIDDGVTPNDTLIASTDNVQFSWILAASR